MKKLIVILSCLFILSGCVELNSGNVQQDLDTLLDYILEQPTLRADHRKPLYSYGLPYGIGRKESEDVSSVFTFDDSQIILNIDVASIINERYYPDGQDGASNFRNLTQVASKKGQFANEQGQTADYTCTIYELSDTQWVVLLKLNNAELISLTDASSAVVISGEMMKIARSLQIDQNEIMLVYSQKRTPSATRKKLDLITEVTPANGRVDEMIKDDKILENLGGVDESDEEIIEDEEMEIPDHF